MFSFFAINQRNGSFHFEFTFSVSFFLRTVRNLK
nr:MAG TPA: hypothetical protein [Caudoviricetes sp.]